MTGKIILFLAISFFSVVTPIHDHPASAAGPCDSREYIVRPDMDRDKIDRRMRRLIRCAVARWHVSGGARKAISVARCESSLWPWANGGSHLGIYQHRDLYWKSRVENLLDKDWFSERKWKRIHRDASIHPGAAFHARANVLVAIRMAHRSGWGAWTCA